MRFRCLCVALACLAKAVLGGCGSDCRPDDVRWYQATAACGNLPAGQLLEAISRQDSLFRLYEMKRDYIMGGEDSQAIVVALDARRDELVSARETAAAIPGKVDFVDYEVRKLAEGGYLVSAYFVARERPARDWRLNLIAKAEEAPSARRPGTPPAAALRYKLQPETSVWKKGEHRILSQAFDFDAISYEISGEFFLYPDGVYADPFKCGRFAASDE